MDWIEGEMIAFFQLMSPRERAILSATARFFFLKKKNSYMRVMFSELLDRGYNVPSPHKFFSTRKKKSYENASVSIIKLKQF